MLLTDQVPSDSPPSVGDRTDPVQLSAVGKALAASQAESCSHEESLSVTMPLWRPSPSSSWGRAVQPFPCDWGD